MKAIQFFKLDMILMRSVLKTYALILPFVVVMFFMKQSMMILSYLLLLLLLTLPLPFTTTYVSNNKKLYYMMPAKTSSMVLGRYLFLAFITVAILIVEAAIILYLYQRGEIGSVHIAAIIMADACSLLIGLCQYPVFYLFNMEKAKVLTMMIYMVPAFAIYVFTSVLVEDKASLIREVIGIMESRQLMVALAAILAVVSASWLSYWTSCRICLNKDIK